MNPTQNKYTQAGQVRSSSTNPSASVSANSIAAALASAIGQDATVSGNGPAPRTPIPCKTGVSSTPYVFRTRAYTANRTASGQNITPDGNLSALRNGMTIKKRMNIEKAARLCATGLYTDKIIADHLGITQPYLSQLKTTKEFQSAAVAVITGVLSKENEAILSTIETRREELSAMVPMALMRLRNLALSRNESIAAKAVAEILDRDGNLAKVSKSSIELKKTEDLTEANNTANSILDILRPHIQANPNNPDSDPIGAIAPGFTVSAQEAKVQIGTMSEQINEQTLDTIDAANSTVQ